MRGVPLERQQLEELDDRYLWHGWTPNAQRACERLVLVRGEGSYVWDVDGRRYIDAKGSAMNGSCGYANHDIAAAVYDQMVTLMNHDLMGFATVPTIELAQRIAGLLPPGLERTFFTNSGSEATEVAFKIARSYHRMRGEMRRTKILSLDHGYHGTTTGAMYASPTPLSVGGVCIPDDYAWITTTFADRRGASLEVSLDAVSTAVQLAGPECIAAIVIEPVLGVGGVHIPPKGFLSGVREICDANGILLILDEVLTGFGRTGRMFGAEHDGVVADIVNTSKAMSSGYFPIAATTTTQKIYSVFATDSYLGGLRHGHTTSGHTCAARAALETIDIIEREHLVDNAATVGGLLLSELEELLEVPGIVDVRGQGLLIGIETNASETAAGIVRNARDHGLIVRQQGVTGNIVCLTPPLILSPELAIEIACILRDIAA